MYKEAFDALNQSIKINPEYELAHLSFGFINLKLGKYQDAVNEYKQAIRMKPDCPKAHFLLGMAYIVLGDKDSALKEYLLLKDLDSKKAQELLVEINKL